MTTPAEKNINRRDLLKRSVAAGAALATGALTTMADAAVFQPPHADRPEAAKNHFLKSMN